MSTDAPLPSAPELPLHDEVVATSSWAYRHCAGRDKDGINRKAETIQPTAPEMEENLGIDTDKMANTSKTSATAYSFSGSALNGETNKKESNAETKSNEESSTNGNNNNTNNTNNNSSSSNSKINDEDKNDDSMYECNICLDTAKDAVVSMCGHLFCWPCLHQWLETRPNRKLCPVCKAAIGKDKVIPLYGRNSTKQEDPRNKVPPRPAGQRTEPEPQQGFQGFGFGDGFHMSFGIGAFPFGYFASSFNFGEPRPAAANRGNSQYEDEQQLSKMFLYLAFLCIAWLLFA